MLKKIEDVLFLDWQKIHPLGFTKPEEDEPIFILSMVTPVYYLLCPFVQDLSYLTNMDKMSQSTINNMMSFYKNSLKSVYINSIATNNIANKPIQPIHLYFFIHFEIRVAAVAIKIIDKTNQKTNNV